MPIVVFPKAADPPTAPVNVVVPEPATISKVLVVLSLLSVLDETISLFADVNVMLPPNVAASL